MLDTPNLFALRKISNLMLDHHRLLCMYNLMPESDYERQEEQIFDLLDKWYDPLNDKERDFANQMSGDLFQIRGEERPLTFENTTEATTFDDLGKMLKEKKYETVLTLLRLEPFFSANEEKKAFYRSRCYTRLGFHEVGRAFDQLWMRLSENDS